MSAPAPASTLLTRPSATPEHPLITGLLAFGMAAVLFWTALIVIPS